MVLLFLSSVLFWPVSVFAQVQPISPIGQLNDQGDNVGTENKAGEFYDADSVTKMIVRIVNWFSWFIAVASVIMGLYSGMLFITARGNTAQLETARQILIYAVIGIIVAVLAFSIVTITKTLLNIPNI